MVHILLEGEVSWPVLVAAAVFVPEFVSIVAALLHRSRVGSPLPSALEGIYDAGEYETSNRYTKANIDFGLAKDTFDLVVFFLFWFLHGFPFIDSLCESFGFASQIVTGLIFIGIMGLASFLLDLPWDCYQTFVLENSFGFNKTTPATFIKDRLKVLGLALSLGVPLLSVVLWFFISVGDNAWIWVFVVVTIFQLLLFFLMPVFLLPLFFKLIPLPEGKVVITGKAGSNVPSVLSGRIFYTRELFNNALCWKTLDGRFAGASVGSVLSLCWSTASACWTIVEGEPEDGGVVYATCAENIDNIGKVSDGPVWEMTQQGLDALSRVDAKGAEGPGEGRQSSISDPLFSEELRTVSVDVGSLRRKLLALADRLGYFGANIFVIDGSSRSEHSNAFCTGFGKSRRICLFDTLLPLMDEDEIVAVLAHEIGHDRLYHVHSGLAISILYLFVTLYVMGQFLNSEAISSAFFVHEPKVYLGIVLFSIIWSVVEFAIQIPMIMRTRSNEFAADRYSVAADARNAEFLAGALTKLTKKSRSNLTPHPFYVFLKYSHPPLDARLAEIRAYHAVAHRRPS